MAGAGLTGGGAGGRGRVQEASGGRGRGTATEGSGEHDGDRSAQAGAEEKPVRARGRLSSSRGPDSRTDARWAEHKARPLRISRLRKRVGHHAVAGGYGGAWRTNYGGAAPMLVG